MNPVRVPFFISHQGCRHACVFCNQHTISGSDGHLPDSEELLAKIADWQFSAAGRPLEVAFFGGSFTALDHSIQHALLEPLQPLLASGEISSIRLSTRPDAVDAACVDWLAGKGVSCIELGVQSLCDEVLSAAGRGHTAAAALAAIRCVRAAGVTVGAQLMPGLPEDTVARSLESLDQVIAAGADFIRLYPVVVLQGTALAYRYSRGEYQPLTLEEGVALCKVMLHRAEQAGVEVVRIGLQADDGLNADTVLAGCYHPAFGQLVRAERYFDLMRLLTVGMLGQECEIVCHPAHVSDVAGHGKTNLQRLADRGIHALRIMTDSALTPEQVVVRSGQQQRVGALLQDLVYPLEEDRVEESSA